MTDVKYHMFRLLPGQDLKKEILEFVSANNISAGWISTCVGSLTRYAIRFANQPEPSTATGYFEILGLSGTLSVNGVHIHICLGDAFGGTVGGHLAEGNIIYTTAEIIIASTSARTLERVYDVRSGFNELVIRENQLPTK